MPASRVTAEARAAGSAVRHVRVAPLGWAHPLRSAACMAVPLTAGVAAGRPAYGMIASLGALSGLYGQAFPFRRRGRVMAGVALAIACASVAASLAAPSSVAAVMVVGLVAVLATFTCLTLEVGPPREHMIVLVALMMATLPLDPAGAWARGGLVLAGGAVAWVIGMSGWLHDRSRPERVAVAGALDAVAALLHAVAARSPTLEVARHQAAVAASTSAHAVAAASGPSAATLRAVQEHIDELFGAAAGLEGRDEPVDPAWSQELRTLATTVRAAVVADVSPSEKNTTTAPTPRGSPTLVVVDVSDSETEATTELAPPAWRTRQAIARIGELLAGAEPGEHLAHLRPRRMPVLRHSLALPAALRAGVAIALALWIGHLLRVGQPYWIALTVSAVLQGSTLVTSLRRGIERTAGTLVGVLIAAAVGALDPAAGVLVAAIVGAQLLTEATIATSYAVAVAFITPLTLMLSDLGHPGSITESALGGRIVDTLIGAGVGIAAGRLLWPSAARVRILGASSASVRAIGGLIVAGLQSGADSEQAKHRRNDLHVELLNLRAVSDAALADRLDSEPAADVRWPVIASIERTGYLVAGAPFEADGVPDGLEPALAALADAAGRTVPSAIPRIPAIPRTWAIPRELDHLAALLREPDRADRA